MTATFETGAKVYEQKRDALGRSYGTGRRKGASARVWVKSGKGKIIINGHDQTKYFARPVLQMLLQQPFDATKTTGQFDVWCTVSGGGLSGQAGAVRHGIARALVAFDPAFQPALRQAGSGGASGSLLTRDSREVERKKYGKAKARRSFQFSKR